MSPAYQELSLLVLAAWVGLWWLAVRTVFGQRFGPLEWIPVAVLALAVPMVVVDTVAAAGLSAGPLLIAWGGLAVGIDAVGALSWFLRRRARCGEEDVEQVAAPDRPRD
jgi:hypothetical protein